MTDTDTPDGGWESWMDNPLMTDQQEGFEITEPPLHQMQVRQPDGSWMLFNSPRRDREEVTRIQASHLAKDPDDLDLRVLTKRVIWTVDEVPGHGEGKTPPEEIIARNEAATKRRLTSEEATPQ